MHFTLQDLSGHGYLALIVVALLERLGLPLLVTPFLIAAGAMAAAGWMNLGLIILAVAIPAVAVDLGWYWLGRTHGLTILRLICKLSLERDSCVRRTQAYTARHAGLTLIYSKFVPGISHLAPPMMGMANVRFRDFLLWETAGSVIWSLCLALVGYAAARGVYRPTLAQILLGYLPAVIALLVIGNILWKFVSRQMFIRSLRALRIAPQELRDKLGSDDLIVIDLRHPLDVLHDPRAITGAISIYPEELANQYHQIPADKDIVLYCT
jgi:membrane protein DedA with SNARE-associated domain